MAYLEFEIPLKSWSPVEKEILVARLFEFGFGGFAEERELLQAYIEQERFKSEEFNLLLDDLKDQGLQVQYRFHSAPDQNWNNEWEKSFSPVVIDEKVLIRAPFHDSGNDLDCTLVIEPKMSFGTGHHATTKLMIGEMLKMDLTSLSVLDMGCGTGVLGIFASRKGARRVLGVDNDQWAYKNALENAALNQAANLEIRLGDAGSLGDENFDVVLANITRNTLVRDLPVYAARLNPGGIMLLSGILTEDVLSVLNTAYECGVKHTGTTEASNWILLTFTKVP